MWKANLCFAVAFGCLFLWLHGAMKKCDHAKTFQAALAVKKHAGKKK